MGMPSKIFSAAILGLDAQIIEVETDVSFGMRCFNIVGLADKAVDESKERVASAIKSSGFKPPYSQPQRILTSLAPADIKKEGSLYDLPIALGYLAASKQIQFNAGQKIFAGELALDGKLRQIKGALSLALAAQEKNWEEIIIPKQNAAEAALALCAENNLKEIKITAVDSLKETIDYLLGKIKIEPFKINANNFKEFKRPKIDISWIKGQESAKRALEVCAAGGHNLLMQGPPGAGKSILAQSLPSILPEPSFKEVLEITKIHSIAGFLNKENPVIWTRPFRAPHHTTSEAALIGGGNPPMPGEITLAHRGVLFLDEFPEFHRDVLESMRQPLEDGTITVLRARTRLSLPARFSLIAAANPCPCGYYRDPEKSCSCTPSQIAKYKRKLSGPLIDRFDIFIDVPAVKFEKLDSSQENGSTSDLKVKIENARKRQEERFKNDDISTNSEMGIPEIKKYCAIDEKSRQTIGKFVDSGELSARGYHRVLKTARTIADLEQSPDIQYNHIMEALMYRIREN
jgi:magnesium chelatase family protein